MCGCDLLWLCMCVMCYHIPSDHARLLVTSECVYMCPGLRVCRQRRSSLVVRVSVKFASDNICGSRPLRKLPVCPVVTWWYVDTVFTAIILCLCAYNLSLNTFALGANVSDLCVSLGDIVCPGPGVYGWNPLGLCL